VDDNARRENEIGRAHVSGASSEPDAEAVRLVRARWRLGVLRRVLAVLPFAGPLRRRADARMSEYVAEAMRLARRSR